MNATSSPNLNLTVKDHIKLLKALINREDFQNLMLEDPAAALCEYIPELSQEELDALPDDSVAIPTKEVLQQLIDELREADRMGEFPFTVENFMCGLRR